MRTVRPSPQWQDSLIRLESGQRVVIDAEETWSPDMRNQIAWCGADGLYNLPADEGYLLPGANVGALIVGSRYDFIADRAGILHLAMNENPDFNNQAGKVVAQIIVFSQP